MDQMESCVPPGFRFRPTEEELVGYYLKRKINSINTDLDVIVDIDLYKMEPWDIQERCNLGYNEQNEWYFFSHKDKKYPTGTRTNRATTAGFWKATGRDKAVLSKTRIIGMRKTLVFYKGRAPNGRRSDWILHEYRLQSSEHAPPHEEGWVVCRAFKKPTPNHRQSYEAWSHACYARQHNNTYTMYSNQGTNVHKTSDSDNAHDLTMMSCNNINESPFLNYNNQLIDLPQLESPTVSTSFARTQLGSNQSALGDVEDCFEDDKYVDWKNLDGLIDQNNVMTWNGLL